MEELRQEGRVRAIGVANFAPDRLMDLIVNSGVIPAVDQIETHPFNQQVATQKFLQDRGVQIESWGPFAELRTHLETVRAVVMTGVEPGRDALARLAHGGVARRVLRKHRADRASHLGMQSATGADPAYTMPEQALRSQNDDELGTVHRYRTLRALPACSGCGPPDRGIGFVGLWRRNSDRIGASSPKPVLVTCRIHRCSDSPGRSGCPGRTRPESCRGRRPCDRCSLTSPPSSEHTVTGQNGF